MTSDLVHSFIDEVWNRRNLDLLGKLVVDDYQLRNLADGSVPVRGREELRTHIEECLACGLPLGSGPAFVGAAVSDDRGRLLRVARG